VRYCPVVTLARRLQALDDRVLPLRSARKYDERTPIWLALGSVVGSFSGVGLVLAWLHMTGAVRVLVCVVIAVVLAGDLIATQHWVRRHLIPLVDRI
jgi:hypothetical protein